MTQLQVEKNNELLSLKISYQNSKIKDDNETINSTVLPWISPIISFKKYVPKQQICS